MQGLLRSKGDTADCDWGFQDKFSEDEYSPSVTLGSADKVLSLDSLRDITFQGNYYRQIHEDERRLTQFIGRVNRSSQATRSVLFCTTGVVDSRTKTKLYLTVKSGSGSPEQLVVSREICSGRTPAKGDFVIYTIYQIGEGELTHEIKKVCPPQLSEQEEASIDARIGKLSF